MIWQSSRSKPTGGVQPEAVSASIVRGESLVTSKQYAPAQTELEAALATSERIGLLVQQAQSHYWLSQALTGAGTDTAGARQHLQAARGLLDRIKAEAKTDAVLKRADLAPIAAAK